MNIFLRCAWLLPALMLLVAGAAGAADPVNLTGTWTGTARYYAKGVGFKEQKYTLVIEEQHGPIFKGKQTYLSSRVQERLTQELAGVIGEDGQTILLTGPGDGQMSGRIDGPDRMILRFVSPANTLPSAAFIEVTRGR